MIRLTESGIILNLTSLTKDQDRFAKYVKRYNDPSYSSSIVIGLDVAYSKNRAAGVAIVFDNSLKKIVTSETVVREIESEYIPGFFQLREGPILIDLVQNLKTNGIVLVDGNGILHPRRFGLASYLGIKMNVQTIGVAKKLLLGNLGPRSGNCAEIIHADEVLGRALWLNGRKPIYVSIGHRVSLETAVKVVTDSSTDGHPEVLRRAHILSKRLLKTKMD